MHTVFTQSDATATIHFIAQFCVASIQEWHLLISRVNNKEGKRVSNALYALYFWKVTRQEFENWPVRVLDSNSWLWAWHRVRANASVISTENNGDSKYRTSVHEGILHKSHESFLILHKLEKN